MGEPDLSTSRGSNDDWSAQKYSSCLAGSESFSIKAARAALKVWENLTCVAMYKWFDFYLLLNKFIGSTFLLRTSTEATLGQIHVDEFRNTKSDTASTSKLISEYKEGQYRTVVGNLSNKRQKDESREEHRERIRLSTDYRENLQYACDYSATP